MKNHQKMHDGVKKYKCNLCNDTFLQITALKYHQNRDHLAEPPFKCNNCSRRFASKSNLKQHQISHSPGSRPYRCENCSRTFSQRSNLLAHFLIHNNYRPYKCKYCIAAYRDKRLFEIHVLKKHSLGSYCSKCNIQFANETEKIEHDKTFHIFELKCAHCNFQTLSKTALLGHTKIHERAQRILNPVKRRDHLNMNPQDDEDFTCKSCNIRFQDTKSFSAHAKMHLKTTNLNVGTTSRARVYCHICAKNTTKDHLTSAHKFSLQFKCPICDKSFSYRASRSYHVLRHSADGGTYMCSIKNCKKKFAHKYTRNRHEMLVHASEKHGLRQCSHCSQVFANEDRLREHMKNLNVQRKFQCHFCKGKMYKTMAALKRHFISNHKESWMSMNLAEKSKFNAEFERPTEVSSEARSKVIGIVDTMTRWLSYLWPASNVLNVSQAAALA